MSAKDQTETQASTTPRRASGVSRHEQHALVLQGGGALGAYQAGVYEALAAHGLQPQWVAGISIGAINAAIIAGNPPEKRVGQLREFWEGVSSQLIAPGIPASYGDKAREMFNESSAALVAAIGVPGFFRPRYPPAPFQPAGTPGALSYYDTAPLEKTLERLIDFDLINTADPKHRVRLSVGAVNVRTGNFVYFDSDAKDPPDGSKPERARLITPRHIMASGALPPGFAPVEIEGEWYWDGGLVSNTPLQYVLDQPMTRDMLVMQVDLFSARGPMPTNLSEVAGREKDIRFASRTRLNTDVMARQQKIAHAARSLAARLPARFADDPDLKLLMETGSPAAVTVMHLIHRSKLYETQSKDYEFSRAAVQEHWASGLADVNRSLKDPRWVSRGKPAAGIRVFDLTRD
ncbi:MAG: patatin-like phospholipase family protein [Comamonadaceae bacterium]|nr:MAG: patatin-like phospholipase family protein [Comamonadaceae bacterium]